MYSGPSGGCLRDRGLGTLPSARGPEIRDSSLLSFVVTVGDEGVLPIGRDSRVSRTK